MDYASELIRMRTNMHRDIVQEATVKTFNQHYGDNAELTLRIPLCIDCSDDNIYVIGVSCSSGDLISEDDNGNRNTVKYYNLSMEELSMLHKAIVETKDYKINHLV